MRRLDDLGIMINGSFVFGLDSDDPDVFARTVDWGVEQGITTRHVPRPDTVPGYRAVRGDGSAGTDRDEELGFVRHAARGLSAQPVVAGGVEARLRLGLRGVLPVELDLPGGRGAPIVKAQAEALFLQCRVEEVRGGLGFGDSDQATGADTPLLEAVLAPVGRQAADRTREILPASR